MNEALQSAAANVFDSFVGAIGRSAPYWGVFIGTLVLSLLLTPVFRALSVRLGMLDQPGERRINKVPIPRGGGIAVFFAATGALAAFFAVTGGAPIAHGLSAARLSIVGGLAAALVAVGYADDKFSLPPKVKLLGQVAVAVLTWQFADVSVLEGFLGFSRAETAANGWLEAADVFATVFWLVGAVNAFNLIDGLDGLASGLGAIGAFGMAGAILFASDDPALAIPHLAVAGACLGFLRYNFNPASVFLGDSGSMFIGYSLAALPLLTNSGGSLFVSLGVPVLVMGVPIFDTFLAIVRRSLRALIRREENTAGDENIMKADADHLHHRMLRRFGGSQRTVAKMLYGFALFLTAVAMGGIYLKDRASALFIVAFIVALVVVVRDLMRVELFDTGRLATDIAFSRKPRRIRMRSMLDVPLSLGADVFFMAAAWAVSNRLLHTPLDKNAFRLFPLFVLPVLCTYAASGVYRIAWGRSQVTDFARLLSSLVSGVALAAAIAIFAGVRVPHLVAVSFLFSGLSFFPMAGFRILRAVARDAFFALECLRLANDPSAERILVYGAGLRFRSFRRELVRNFGRNRRVIVGIIDDAPAVRRRVISGIRVLGSIASARKIIQDFKVDSVVITARLPEKRVLAVKRFLSGEGVKVTMWTCDEIVLSEGSRANESETRT